ncbi:hypothetical protein PVA38_10690 [Streptococcus pneumoniae D39]|nr:hypothetical protein PVA38_10690 [Streptococcus pneumoniae D39]
MWIKKVLSYSHTIDIISVSYTHLRAHETVLDLVCRLLLEKKNHILSIRTTTLHCTRLFFLIIAYYILSCFYNVTT